ncbi:MAG: acetyl-CoA carboxylase carboxyl transferase subunit alpha [Gaiellaceae bacterium]|nr:acetyl-CoA carboxylase carboxyl transferase subunit alpha [Gaiellaceae bacterium]
MVRVTEDIRRLRRRFQERGEESQVWDVVQNARHQDRPYSLDYAQRLFGDSYELHGDRTAGDDPAIVAGIATYHGRPVAFVGHQKGRDLAERTHRNFGMARPEGYRKAIRAIELADRLGYPILTFVDTPGAYPGVGAEQAGQAGTIARSILALARVSVPVICSVIGEGGSGGALAIAVGDRILMQENAIYSVISPEGCAAILWKDAGQARKAAYAFRPTARACLDLGVIDVIVPEPSGGAHRDHDRAARLLDESIRTALAEVEAEPVGMRRRARREKFRSMGVWGVAEAD